jgi:hypothetical protein
MTTPEASKGEIAVPELPRELMESLLAAAEEATFQVVDAAVVKDVFVDQKIRRIFGAVYRMGFESGWRIHEKHTADQMLSFYQQGVAAERERCAVLCLTHRNFLSDKEYSYADECAAAIRKGE